MRFYTQSIAILFCFLKNKRKEQIIALILETPIWFIGNKNETARDVKG